jgi:EpsD family peptidyl-prolyl cis-trans isomerase
MSASFGDRTGFGIVPKIVTLLIASATVSCGGPKPGGQTIAVVDGQPVTEAELNVDMAGLPRQGSQQERNDALQSLINRKIFVAAAKKQGLDKDPNFKLEMERQQEIMLAKRYLAQATAGIGSSISDADINNFLTANPQFGPARKMMVVDQIQFSMPTDKNVLAEMKATQSMEALTQVLQKHRIPVEPGRANLDSSILPAVMYKGLLGTQSGEPMVLANGDRTLAQVLVSMTDAPLPSDKAQQIARRNLEQQRVAERLRQQADALRGAAKIEYGKGFSAPKAPAPAGSR